jgi:hypothetical protein
MQSWIERAVLHLQEFVGGSLNMLADLMTVSWTVKKGSQDEHVQSSLQKVGALLCLFGHGRQSTLNLAVMVDTRLSIVKRRIIVWIFDL